MPFCDISVNAYSLNDFFLAFENLNVTTDKQNQFAKGIKNGNKKNG